MRVQIGLLWCVLIGVVLGVACAPSADADERTPALTVGVILPLTGDGASFGRALQSGMLIARDELPLERREQLTFLFEDDGMAARNSLSAFWHLTQRTKIDLLVNITSGTGNALAPAAEEKKVPFVAIASDRKISAGKRFVVNFLVTPEDEARAVVLEAVHRQYRRIARFTTTQEGTLSLSRAFDAENQGQIAIAYDEDRPLQDKDVRSFAVRVKALGSIDAVLNVCLPGHCGIVARQLREQGVAVPIFGFHPFEDWREIESAQGGLHGGWYVSAGNPDPRFLQGMRERNGDLSALWAAVHGHDLALLAYRAFQRGKAGQDLLDGICNDKDFVGVLGQISCLPNRSFSIPARIREIDALFPSSH